MSLSTITVSGTLKEDPEKRFTPTNIAVTNLKLEVCYVPRGSGIQSGTISSQTIKVNAWRDMAEYCEKNLRAGDKIIVTGRAMINNFTTNDGKKKRTLEIDTTSVVPVRNILELQPPPKKDTEQKIEQVLSLDEVTNTEEIPF